MEEEVESENRRWSDLKNLDRNNEDAVRASGQRKENLERTSAALSESEDRRTEAEGDFGNGYNCMLPSCNGLTDNGSRQHQVLNFFQGTFN